jgi:hypothetical protein
MLQTWLKTLIRNLYTCIQDMSLIVISHVQVPCAGHESESILCDDDGIMNYCHSHDNLGARNSFQQLLVPVYYYLNWPLIIMRIALSFFSTAIESVTRKIANWITAHETTFLYQFWHMFRLSLLICLVVVLSDMSRLAGMWSKTPRSTLLFKVKDVWPEDQRGLRPSLSWVNITSTWLIAQWYIRSSRSR